jgi:hypothetical protein
MTPEGDVKEKIKLLLDEHDIVSAKEAILVGPGDKGWYFMPVSNGMGVTGIPDFLGHYKGRFFSIEAKATGKRPTKLQAFQIRAIDLTGGKHFTITGDLSGLRLWLSALEKGGSL